MLKNVQMAGFKTPTPIQRYCIPAIGMGHDVIAIAQTGEYSPQALNFIQALTFPSQVLERLALT